MQLGLGVDRIMFIIMIFMIITHLISCLWVLLPQFFEADDGNSWITGTDIDQEQEGWRSSLYATSVYWTITTMSTVGYGDISGTNGPEKIFCAIIMIIGVTFFSYGNGAVASLLSNFDSAEAVNKTNLESLRSIRQ